MQKKTSVKTRVVMAVAASLVFALSVAGIGSQHVSERTVGAADIALVSWTESIGPVPASPVSDMPLGPKNDWAAKTAAFTACIFGVGVPIGLAIGVATNPQVWAWVLGRGPWPASVGGSAAKYLDTVKRQCAYALR